MSSKSQPTPGPWHYRPSQTRHVVSETGESVCRVHRGKKAQHNGPLLAAAHDLLEELIDRYEQTKCGCNRPGCSLCRSDEDTLKVIAKAKGDTG